MPASNHRIKRPALLLAESRDDVCGFIGMGAGGGDEWVALGPAAMAELDKMGIGYRPADDYFDPEELGAVCRKTSVEVERLARILDGALSAVCPSLSQRDVKPFQLGLFPMIIMFQGLKGRAFILKRISEKIPDRTFHAFYNPAMDFGLYDLLFGRGETLYSELLNLPLLLGKDVNLIERSLKTPASMRGRLAKKILASPLLTTVYLGRAEGIASSALKALGSAPKGTLLLLGNDREWRHVIPGLEARGFRVLNASFHNIFGHWPSVPSGLTDAAIAGSEESRAAFFFEGGDIYPILRDRINRLAAMAWAASENGVERAESLRKRWNVRGVLSSGIAHPAEHLMKKIFLSMGLPVINWQQGFIGRHGGITQFHHFLELASTSHEFAYGNDTAEALRAAGGSDAEVIPIGSPSMEAFKNAGSPVRRGGRPRILYATSNYYANAWYAGFSPPFSDRLFYRDQREIVRFLGKKASEGIIEATVKLHPGPDTLRPDWCGGVPGVRFVRNEKTYMELIGEHDCLVLDLPTTTALQSAASRLPMFVLTGHLKYTDEEAGLLRRRAACAEKVSELARMLERWMASSEYPADDADSSFLGHFVMTEGAVDRAMEKLNEILDRA